MCFFETFFVALALSMDALAVSTAYGMGGSRANFKVAAILGLAFGTFQAAMPIAGFYLSRIAGDNLECVDHWIAFVLLSIVGGKMILDSFKSEAEIIPQRLGVLTVLTLAVATSLDAFAVGVSYACVGNKIFAPAVLIGFVTFSLSFAGVLFGAKLGLRFGSRATFAGGLVLLLIGLRILLTGI